MKNKWYEKVEEIETRIIYKCKNCDETFTKRPVNNNCKKCIIKLEQEKFLKILKKLNINDYEINKYWKDEIKIKIDFNNNKYESNYYLKAFVPQYLKIGVRANLKESILILKDEIKIINKKIELLTLIDKELEKMEQ